MFRFWFLTYLAFFSLRLALVSPATFGQVPAASVFVSSYQFTSDQGLSQNNIYAFAKDPDGYVWIGTGDGLDRFDGYSFVHFNHSDNDSTSLSNDVVQNLLIDSKGRLWVGTYNGLNLYDANTQSFRVFLDHNSHADKISQNTIQFMLEDRTGHLWVSTYRGLNKINIETFEITQYYQRDSGDGLADNEVSALLEDREGKIWVCTGRGINIFGPAGIEKTIPVSSAANGLPEVIIADMIQDSTGAIFFATNGRGLLRLENENDLTFEHFTHKPGNGSLGTNLIAALEIDQQGHLLIGTDGAGLYLYNGNGTFTHIIDRNKPVLDMANIRQVYVDDENNYWTGLFGGGALFVPGQRPRFEHYRIFDATMEKLAKNSILAIVEDHDQNIWIGTDGSGLYEFNPRTRAFTSYRHSETDDKSLSTNVVKSLLVDHNNNLYIGTFAGGMNFLDTRTKTVSRYYHNPNDSLSISTNHVWSLLEDSKHRIFVGQLGGLDEFIPETRKFKKIVIPGPRQVTAQTASVFSMVEDKKGQIWMGTRLAGIHRYDPSTRTFRSFLSTPRDSVSIPTNEIIDLSLDSKGNLLIGTDNKGLVRMNPETFEFNVMLPAFAEENISSVLEDENGHLWFSSFDGLHRYDPAKQAVYNYTTADGLQGTQYNEGACLRSSSGDYYFGGTNGLNVFRPAQMKEDETKPRVVFTRLTLFHDEVRINDPTGILNRSISKTDAITLLPSQNVFSLEFACLENKFPKKNRYRYFLEGFDNRWNEIGENRTVTFTNLPPGDYTLKISATNANGYWHEDAARMKILVIAKWYERSDVRAAAGILLVLLVLTFIHVRTRFLLNQKRKLEHLVLVRTQLVESQKEQIRDKNEKLENAYEEVNSVNEELHRINANLEKLVEDRTDELRHTIKKLIETDEGLNTFLYRSSHDLRGPITSLLGLAQLAKKQNQQPELAPYFENIEKTATRMLRLLKRLVETSALFRAKLRAEPVDTETFIQHLNTQVNEINADNAVSVSINCNLSKTFKGDARLLTIIVVNLLENSIVFRSSVDPFARCEIYYESNFLVIKVTDNGIGISSEIQDKNFDMFYRGSERSLGNGLGLFMVKKALEILNGSIDIRNQQDKLTTITVRVQKF